MNRRQLETLLLTLESTPALVARAAEGWSPAQARENPPPGGFSLVENVWHLADLEREGYAVRIRRLLAEEDPRLSNFDGERVARERCYKNRDLSEGLAAFSSARAENVEMLRSVHNSDWTRRGIQESVGPVALEDLPRMMAEHDRAHIAEIADLLEWLKTGKAVDSQPTSAVA